MTGGKPIETKIEPHIISGRRPSENAHFVGTFSKTRTNPHIKKHGNAYSSRANQSPLGRSGRTRGNSTNVSKMPHTYRVVKVQGGYKIKSQTKTLKQTYKSKRSATARINNLYKLAKGHKRQTKY